MRAPARLVRALIDNRKGATAVEYGLILALCVLAVIGALQGLGGATTTMWNNVSAKVQATN